MASNGFQTPHTSYANERPPSSTGSGDAEVASDPASSSFFTNDYKKHDDLKTMLDTNKDSLKLEAMKRIIGMVAKGKDASELFPAVVKNVVSKNIEVKKLVYVYLVRYAEEQQDLALLSISTFQRALKDPNQLIRASALRVLSSIRVPMIVPIMMLAIKEAVMDMSPYVRKTAAHAIPKLYSLDPEQKDTLNEVIEKLLADKTTLVAGSAIQAFEEVCPERIDLIHKNYRKLCNLLVDVEEWGQVVIINMLTRYIRTQFINPNEEEESLDEHSEKAFYGSDDSDEEKEKEDSTKEKDQKPKKPYSMDADHRLLLRTTKPLLNSRNASVVMAVAQLYHHCAPRSEVNLVSKALIRLLRGHKEVQYVVLSNIASMSIKRKGMFEPYLKSFYVRSNDPTQVKLLKLEILTNLATETSISTILREFQTYVTSPDQEFAAATIQAIGRCASNIDEITDACLNGLVSLLSNRNETVVGESVVVIKKLLQMQPTEHKEIIIHLAKLADSITVPMARASILWLIGEYSDRVPKIAPDVLRKMAKSFINEEDIVKLQILNLAAKLHITNSKQTKLLCQYVFNLAKYDQNYDIRDRARFLRSLVLPGEKGGALSKHAKKIFLATKPAPVLESKFKDRDQFQLATLSHLIDNKAAGYQELPDWPEDAPDPGVRNVEVTMPWLEGKSKERKKADKKKSFYSDEDSSSAGSSSSSDSSSDSSGSGSESSESESEEKSSSASSSSGGGEETESSSETEEELVKPARALKLAPKPAVSKKKESSDDEDSSSEESSEDSSEEDSSEEEIVVTSKKMTSKHKKKETKKSKGSAPQRPTEMLLDLDFDDPGAGASTFLSPSSMLTPSAASAAAVSAPKAQPNYNIMSPVYSSTCQHELLNRMTSGGLGATYRFTRNVSIFSPKMVTVDVTFTNTSENPIGGIRIGSKNLQPGMDIHDFPEIATLAANQSTTVLMAIDFNDTTQPAKFDVCSSTKKYSVTITAPVGELLHPNTLTENDFLALQGKLTGMTENSASVDVPTENNNAKSICNCVYEVANVLQVQTTEEDVYRFAGKTASGGVDTLISVKVTDSKAKVTVNCEKMVICSMLLKDLKTSLLKV